MIRITVELVPHGNEDLKRKIGEMVIANDLSGDHPLKGNYQALVAPDSWTQDPAMYYTLKRFDRRSGVWNLISTILNSGKKSKKPQTELQELLETRLGK